MKVILTILLCFSAAQADVKSGGKFAKDYSDRVIHVIQNPDQTKTFIYCDGPECKFLGNKQKYKIIDLKRREHVLKQERAAAILSDTEYIAGSALGAVLTVELAGTPAAPLALIAAHGAFDAGVFVLKSFIDPDKTGLRYRIRAPKFLSDPVLMGQEVRVNMPINEFAQQLDEVLKGIF